MSFSILLFLFYSMLYLIHYILYLKQFSDRQHIVGFCIFILIQYDNLCHLISVFMPLKLNVIIDLVGYTSTILLFVVCPLSFFCIFGFPFSFPPFLPSFAIFEIVLEFNFSVVYLALSLSFFLSLSLSLFFGFFQCLLQGLQYIYLIFHSLLRVNNLPLQIKCKNFITLQFTNSPSLCYSCCIYYNYIH